MHQLLGDRLRTIHDIFGQIPDTLEGEWVKVALGEELEARKMIDTAETVKHPFDAKYSVVHDAKWEDCPVGDQPRGDAGAAEPGVVSSGKYFDFTKMAHTPHQNRRAPHAE